jgi:hypothetical protein
MLHDAFGEAFTQVIHLNPRFWVIDPRALVIYKHGVWMSAWEVEQLTHLQSQTPSASWDRTLQ